MSKIYGRAVGGGGGGFKYILLAYCDTGTVITAEKGDMTYSGTSEGGTAVLILPEGGIWTVYVGDSTDGEEVDFGDEITVVFTPAEAAYTTPQAGVTYNDDISALTEEELNTIAKAISNNAEITNTTTDVYYSGSVGDYHLFTGLSNRSTRNYTYTGQTTQMPCEIVGFNHYDLTDTAAYGEATATGKAGIAWMWKYTTPNYFAPAGNYPGEAVANLLTVCLSQLSKYVNIAVGGYTSSYAQKIISMKCFPVSWGEVNVSAFSGGYNVSNDVFAGYVGASASDRIKQQLGSTSNAEYSTRDGNSTTTGGYPVVTANGASQKNNSNSNRTCGIFNI